MRAALALLIVVALAAPAQAQKLPNKPPAASKLSLRGALGAPQAQGEANDPHAPAPATLPPLLAPLATAPAASKPDAGRCRLSCAQTYYFCLAADASDASCADSWGQCRTRCDQPGPLDRIMVTPQG